MITVQTIPQVLSSPWRAGQPLTRDEAQCLAAALQPVTRESLFAHGIEERVIVSLLGRGLLAENRDSIGPARADLWHGYGWGRPRELLLAADEHRAQAAEKASPRHAPVSGVLNTPEAMARALTRRSIRKFSRDPLPNGMLRTVLAPAGRLLRSFAHLRLYVVAQHVEATPRGVYAYGSDGHLSLLRHEVKDPTMVDVTHQYWALGTGAVLFIGVCWKDLATEHGEGPDAYLMVLSECGRVAHAVVLAATARGVGTWMTPAIDERAAAELCGLKSTEEALYMVKVGMPRAEES